jgi:hypothetical protein
MLTASFRRKTVLAFVFLVLGAPWALAAGPRNSVPPPEAAAFALSPPELLDRVWSLLRAAWTKEGCHIDPSGHCSSATAEPSGQTKEGCNIDPSGRCTP